MRNDDTEKKKKAGNPLFIAFIFVALLAFVFFVPEVYHKYNTNIAEFLGIGTDNKDDKNNNTIDNGIDATSSYYQLGSHQTLEFNEIILSDISLEDGVLNLTVSSKSGKELNLDELDYYLEFYQNKQIFVGRRTLKGIVKNPLSLSIDVSNLGISTTTYLIVSHISDNAIGPLNLDTDESGISSLSCSNKDYIYNYEFYLNKLSKVIKKYTFTSTDLNEYSSHILEYQKYVKNYNELNGVTAAIAENSTTFIFTAEFDYTNIKSFSTIDDEYIFEKNKGANIVNYKMEAEGFDCK